MQSRRGSTMGTTRGFDDDDCIDDTTSGMLVAVRMRPLTDNEKMQGHRSCCRVVGDQVVVIEKFGVPNGHLKSQQSSMKEYAYDIAFPDDASQDEVYTKTVKDIVPTVLNGYHATIFAYGATGAGKTHTMMGSERDGLAEFDDFDEEDFQVDGIIPHALTDIFTIIRHRKEEEAMLNLSQGSTFEWKVLVSYLEVYNEQIRDLLQPSAKALALREDPARGVVHVAGLHNEEAQSVGQVLQLLRRGNRNRKTEPTAANQVSSRSHAVIQVTVRHTTTTMMSEMNPRKSTVEGKLSLIDLAGSERASTTQNRGMRLTEGANINKSLLALANCINSLSSHNRRRSASWDTVEANRRMNDPRQNRAKVQYRDSKLTHLLKNSLEGECRLVMIANLNPSHACFDETHNTLKYANRAKNIKIRPKMHVMTAEMTYQQRIEKLEKENVQLRKALARAQAEIENSSTLPKRKSDQLRDISPETLKKFKSFPWGVESSSGPVGNNQQEEFDAELEAMRKTIRTLHEQKAKLEVEVTGLKTENRQLHARMSKADSFLKTIAEPTQDAMVIEDNQAEEVSPRSTSSFSAGFGLPKRVRVSSPKTKTGTHRPRSSLSIPRPPARVDQENRAESSNFGASKATAAPRSGRRVSFLGDIMDRPVPAPNSARRETINFTPAPNSASSTGSARRVSMFGGSGERFEPGAATPASSRLKRPTQYRKSIGGRV